MMKHGFFITLRHQKWRVRSGEERISLPIESQNPSGVLLIDFIHDQRTVNAAYYCQLFELAKAAYRIKRRDMAIRDAIVLHDNARPPTTIMTKD